MSLRLDPADFEFEGRRIPEHMHKCIREYLVDHVLDPDDFLAAILVNDLRAAVARADWMNLWVIPVYVSYFYNFAPYTCWGSGARVSAWLAAGRVVRPAPEPVRSEVPEE